MTNRLKTFYHSLLTCRGWDFGLILFCQKYVWTKVNWELCMEEISFSIEMIDVKLLTGLVHIFELSHAIQWLEQCAIHCHTTLKILGLQTLIFSLNHSYLSIIFIFEAFGQLFSFLAKLPRILSLTFWDNFEEDNFQVISNYFSFLFWCHWMYHIIKTSGSLLPLDRLF